MCLDLSVIRLGDEIEIVTSNGELLGEWKVVFDQVPVRCGMRMSQLCGVPVFMFHHPANPPRWI